MRGTIYRPPDATEQADIMNEATADTLIKFTPQGVEAMNQVYEEVCNILQAVNADYNARAKAGAAIMLLGRKGETDKRLMRDQALTAAGYGWQ